jgi:hypothetical protein
MGVKPDYQVATRGLYRNLAYQIICNEGALNILSIPCLKPPDSQLLPSWAPDWCPAPQRTRPCQISLPPALAFRRLQRPPSAQSCKVMCLSCMAIYRYSCRPHFFRSWLIAGIGPDRGQCQQHVDPTVPHCLYVWQSQLRRRDLQLPVPRHDSQGSRQQHAG